MTIACGGRPRRRRCCVLSPSPKADTLNLRRGWLSALHFLSALQMVTTKAGSYSMDVQEGVFASAFSKTNISYCLLGLAFFLLFAQQLTMRRNRQMYGDNYNYSVYDSLPQSKLQADEYSKPAGCEFPQYGGSSYVTFASVKLSAKCDTPSVTINRTRELGLGRISKSYHWIRAGNDALNVHCTLGNCTVFYVAKDKFYQKAKAPSAS